MQKIERTRNREKLLETEMETESKKHVTKGRSQQFGSQRGVSTVGLHGKKAEPAFISNHVRRDKHFGNKQAQNKGTRSVQKQIL